MLGGISLDRLVFDPANAEAGANVGAHVRAGDDGTLIGHDADSLKVASRLQDNAGTGLTSTLEGGKQGLDVNIINEIAVDLDHAEDSVRLGDGTNLTSVTPDGALHVSMAANTEVKHSAQSVTTTASQIAATALGNRRRILIQNKGSRSIFIGGSNTVTDANGIEVSRGGSFEDEIGPDAELWAIAEAGSQDVRILERA